jgi:DNA-binding transcriptional LysR family regulator
LLSQSAVSQQIRRLEEELGVEVFRRTSRSVALTPEGQVILGYAKRVLAELDGMHGELEEISGLLSGELRIGGVYPTGPFDLVGCPTRRRPAAVRAGADHATRSCARRWPPCEAWRARASVAVVPRSDCYLGRRPLGESRLQSEIGTAGATLRDLRARLGLDSGWRRPWRR